ncbi:hypothetical protein C1X32_08510 [Pseudomonas sp. GW460-12-1-14-LB3]|nr:hypothetical protein C1X32_08510 [Pseudomonas sp. GW460-12-1-14-LB3]
MGASLLAKAVSQTTSMSNVKQPSRAGPLPQWIGVYLQKRLVGCQAAFAGKPRSYKNSAYSF